MDQGDLGTGCYSFGNRRFGQEKEAFGGIIRNTFHIHLWHG